MRPQSIRPTRTPAQLRNHFEVERALADELRRASREERTRIYARMYDTLFERVPDHPRLVRREDPVATRRKVMRQIRLLRKFVGPSKSFLEFGAGDCRLSFEVCRLARKVVAVDISDQMGDAPSVPNNFWLITYDGYRLDVPDRSIDVVFSNDLIEHIHPDDLPAHFDTTRRILRPGGCYLFTTPHRFTGPHDISRHFSEEPQGFHLKEWTYGELDSLLQERGFSRRRFYRFARGIPLRQPRRPMLALESWIASRPRVGRRALGRAFVPAIVIAAFR